MRDRVALAGVVSLEVGMAMDVTVRPSVGTHSTARGLHEDAQLQAFTTGELCCELLRWGKTANSRLERAARSSAVYMLEAH